jgi:hypothetical protein
MVPWRCIKEGWGMRPVLTRIINLFRNGIYIPQELLQSDQFKILHLGDTPSLIYDTLIAMIGRLSPNMIIHTGDIADDIKLGCNQVYQKQYEFTAGPFIARLAMSAEQVLFIPGNHDSIPFIENIVAPGKIILPGSVIDVNGHTLGVAHYATDLPDQAEYMLYGHNNEMPGDNGGTVLLNGITSINVILLPSGKVFDLKYPPGTNHHRKYKQRLPKLI